MSYVPRRGDLVWLTFQPQAGHEQSRRRPALVVSATDYNRRVGLAILLPITRQIKGYPFEVRLPTDVAVQGVILADQIKSLDWRARRAEFIVRLPDDVVAEAIGKFQALIADGA